MAFITADRVKDTSTTTGTGNITVSGSASFGYRTFSTVLSVSDTFYYCIQGQGTSEWEVGLGTYVSSNQFARTTVLSSSASGSAVSFSSGTKNVFITLAADKTLQIGPSSSVTVPTVIGGTSASSSLTLQSTSGVGTSDSILFKVGNNGATTAMAVNTSGNVGIGTASPGQKLQVNGVIQSGATGTNGSLFLARTSDGLGVGKITMTESTQVMDYNNLLGSGVHTFTVNTVERMRIDSGGYVGIGTSSPGYVLDVNKNIATNSIRIGSYQDTSKQWLLDNTNGGFTINGSGATSSTFMVNVSGSERMRIDSSGNVGIGTVSPSTYGKLAVLGSDGTGFTGITSINSNVNVGIAGVQFGSDPTYVKAAIGLVRSNANGVGSLVFYNDSNADAANWATSDEKMRIDSSGNVGIGVTPTAKLQVYNGYAGFQYNSSGVYPAYNVYFSSIGHNFDGGGSYMDLWNNVGGGFQWHIQTGASAQTTAMTLTSGGNLLVARTTNSTNNAAQIAVSFTQNGQVFTPTTDNKYPITFENAAGTTVGYIYTTSSATTYSTSSDYRLKDNVQPMITGLATVSALKPVTYDWKSDGSSSEGFIAHELHSVIPHAVTGEKDAVNNDGSIKPQGVDYSKIVVHLVAAIQELEARLAKLETVQ